MADVVSTDVVGLTSTAVKTYIDSLGKSDIKTIAVTRLSDSKCLVTVVSTT